MILILSKSHAGNIVSLGELVDSCLGCWLTANRYTIQPYVHFLMPNFIAVIYIVLVCRGCMRGAGDLFNWMVEFSELV